MESLNNSVTEPSSRDSERISRLVVAGELVAAVAHDLRQPLTAIEMNVSAALRLIASSLNEAAASTKSAAIENAEAGLRDALGELGRMRVSLQVLEDLAHHREPAFAAVELVPLVTDVVRLVASEMSVRTTIEVEAPADVPSIMADGTLARQALLNMLIHALESTSSIDQPPEPIAIAVRSPDENTVELAVTYFGASEDTGPAAAPMLALARSIARAHGAPFILRGDPAAGITIAIRWPIRHTIADHAGGVRDVAR